MKPTLPKPKRCAVYTRKSTEHNLDLAFNSLDAQREACEAYIKSQAHEGWRLVPEHYDDGGLSGASLDRPALQGLLTLVRARKVDVIVVYKVDRLTRALADFAKLVEEFDAHDVSFVSVTQSFNTTSSMGRLTLNVLLSFAQFEREVIGERVRDKISASKRKGIWVGGPLPLGYRSRDRILEIEEDEAVTVRTIFERYLQLGSIGLLAEALDRDGIRSRGGYRFGVGGLAHILKNRFYIGEVVYRGEVHPGSQEPIITREVFEAAQAKLAGRAVSRKLRLSRSPSFLAGLLHDDRGNRMSPSHANKRGVRYRYYVSQAVLQSRKADVGSVGRVAAPDLEALVISALRQHVPLEQDGSDRDLVARLVERIDLRAERIDILVRVAAGHETVSEGDTPLEGGNPDGGGDNDTHSDAVPATTTLSVRWSPSQSHAQKGITFAPAKRALLDPHMRDALLLAIAKARSWLDSIVEGTIASFDEIADQEGKAERHIRRLAPLAFLSPRIVQAIADGSAPGDLTITDLTAALPHSWVEQNRKFGIA